jgi:hypothetical protein
VYKYEKIHHARVTRQKIRGKDVRSRAEDLPTRSSAQRWREREGAQGEAREW